MSYELYICEKPSQAADLARNLGADHRSKNYFSNSSNNVFVTWCLGHLLELIPPDEYDPIYKKWRLEDLPIFPETWKYGIKKETSDQYKAVAELVKGSDSVVISTDFDREGEAIARNILTRVRYHKTVRRLCLTALDDHSIQRALKNIIPGSETEPLYTAALARSRADWLIGMNFSRLFTVAEKAGHANLLLPIGRVMTPTVALIAQRDTEIESFVPHPFYMLYADVLAKETAYTAVWLPKDEITDSEGHVTDRKKAEDVLRVCTGGYPKVLKFEESIKKERPPLPFDLNAMQQYAARRWGYHAKMTLDILQSLYEKHKALTYPRTDSRYLPNDQFSDAPHILQQLAMQDPSLAEAVNNADVSRKPSCYQTAKVTAHNAIIPTGAAGVALNKMSVDEYNIYTAARRAFIAQFYPAAEYQCREILLELQGEQFRARSKILRSPGWKVLYEAKGKETNDKKNAKDDKDSDEFINQLLPICKAGDIHQFTGFKIEERITTPPASFNEASLLAAMENITKFVSEPKWKKILKETAGIGTPATRAEIIESALHWKYIIRDGKALHATPKAHYLISIIPEYLKSAGTTAVWEQALEKIASPEQNEQSNPMTMERFLDSIKRFISNTVTAVENKKILPMPPAEALQNEHKSSDSGTYHKRTYTKKSTDSGEKKKSYASRYTRKSTGTASSDEISTDLPDKTRKRSRTKTYSSTRKYSASSAKTRSAGSSTAISGNTPLCPLCGSPMVERKGPRGSFWGCSKYPECHGTKNIDTE